MCWQCYSIVLFQDVRCLAEESLLEISKFFMVVCKDNSTNQNLLFQHKSLLVSLFDKPFGVVNAFSAMIRFCLELTLLWWVSVLVGLIGVI